MPRVVIQQLGKTFLGSRRQKVEAIRQVDITVESGELLVVLGPSGCGKTTLLRLIAGLEEIDSGTIHIDEHLVSELPARDRGIAMVFQSHALFPHLTVAQNLGFGLHLRKVPKAEQKLKVRTMAESLGLVDHLEKLPRQLSGGERQRAALGRALVLEPRVLLLDEPLSNLDPNLRWELRSEIARIQQQRRMTLIYVTHDQSEAMHLGRRIAVMRKGRIEQIASPANLYQNPASLFVAGFIGAPPINLIPGTFRQSGGHLQFQMEFSEENSSAVAVSFGPKFEFAGIDVGRKVVLGIRPENVEIFQDQFPNSSRRVAAQVESMEFAGAETFVHLRLGSRHLIARKSGCFGARPNETVWLQFPEEQVRFFDAETNKAID